MPLNKTKKRKSSYLDLVFAPLFLLLCPNDIQILCFKKYQLRKLCSDYFVAKQPKRHLTNFQNSLDGVYEIIQNSLQKPFQRFSDTMQATISAILFCQKRSFARKADTIRFCQAGLTQQKYSTACESIDSLDNERGVVLLHSIH